MTDQPSNVEPTHDPIPETAAEALAKWDAGESVFSVEMGGLGPGYEQCIQIMAFEIIRDLNGDIDFQRLDSDDDDYKEQVRSRAREATSRCGLGESGAQNGAAMGLAFSVMRRGYRKALRDPAVKDRLIQVSRNMPKSPEPTHAD